MSVFISALGVWQVKSKCQNCWNLSFAFRLPYTGRLRRVSFVRFAYIWPVKYPVPGESCSFSAPKASFFIGNFGNLWDLLCVMWQMPEVIPPERTPNGWILIRNPPNYENCVRSNTFQAADRQDVPHRVGFHLSWCPRVLEVAEWRQWTWRRGVSGGSGPESWGRFLCKKKVTNFHGGLGEYWYITKEKNDNFRSSPFAAVLTAVSISTCSSAVLFKN